MSSEEKRGISLANALPRALKRRPMNDRTLRVLITAIGVLLFAQYWLGMGINLFVTIPQDTPLAFLSYAGGVEVLVHIVNGTLVLVLP